MKRYKINLSMYEGLVREVVSGAIQEKAFELGCWWYGKHEKRAIHKSAPYIFTNEDSSLTMCKVSDAAWFNNHKNIEISAADFLALTPEDIQDKPKAPKEPEFKPFDRVLVRDCDGDEWEIDLFESFSADAPYSFQCLHYEWKQCIPYEGNEHLLGTTEDGLE